YFKEVDFGDKGGLMPFFFGAPTSYENNVRRALEFVLNVYEQTTALQDKGLVLRAGISSGIAYAGIIGGASRSQYAILGNPVNLAARLTMKACWGQIRVDENVQKNPSFHFEFVESIHYKGIEEPVATFLLLDKKTDSHVVFSGAMVGRDEELGALLSFVEDSFLKGKAHITYIFGEAGVGKSRLAFELKNALEKNKDFYWFACPADQILHKPFSPFLSLLKDFFEQHADNKPEQNRQNFERIFQSLLQQLTALPGEQYLSTKKELLRTKSILAAQLGIYYQGSLWSSLDAQGRYQNTLIAYKNYIEATALLKPLVLEIGDAHWYDTDSIGLLNALGKQLQDFPITFLVTSRYLDDGSKPMLFHNDILASVLTQAFDLNMLSAQAVRYFAEDKLGGATSESFHSFLMKISNGNPFYLEQILTYLQECQSIHKQNGQWNADTATLSLPNSMNAVLVARIDRLSKLVKETVKAAAVIGREFELPVLSEVMMQSEPNYQKKHNADTLLKQQVQKAEEGQIWSAISELRYIFKHALLRETIYDMQLHSRLRKLHLLIGSAIEKLYAQRLEEKYVDLAFHFEKAQVIDKTVYYLEKAADFARDNFQNQQAVAFYQKLEKIFKKQKQDKDIVRVLLKKGPVLEMIGEWEVAEENYR
ncbi:MAG TPA: adenylate/guanylate cyclase domain-containing protein, partial [Phaeodactylibacter sp.]|nr:adenylate/guanylate cyclase domain-containing protein [Phaeodactylibacter sp.]